MSQLTSKLLLEPGAFVQQPDHSTGLIFAVAGGQFINTSGVKQSAPNVRLTLSASTVNYIVCSNGGVISTNTTGFTSGAAALYRVTTGSALVTEVEDFRASVRSAAVALTVPIVDLRGTTGLILTATETAGGFNISVSANVHKVQAEITDNETEASVCVAQVVLPVNYLTGTPITVRLRCTIVKTAAAVDNGSTIDLSVYKQADGAVGSDLCETAAQTFTAVDTFYNKDFVVTPTALAAGDTLNLVITSNIVDSEAGAGTLRFNMEPVKILLDVVL